MTNDDFKNLQDFLEKKNHPNKIIVLTTLKEIYQCLGCKWNDGLPHSACYNCD